MVDQLRRQRHSRRLFVRRGRWLVVGLPDARFLGRGGRVVAHALDQFVMRHRSQHVAAGVALGHVTFDPLLHFVRQPAVQKRRQRFVRRMVGSVRHKNLASGQKANATA